MDLAALTKQRSELDADIEVCVRQLVTGIRDGKTKLIRAELLDSFETTFREATSKRVAIQLKIDDIVKTIGENQYVVPPQWNIWDTPEYGDFSDVRETEGKMCEAWEAADTPEFQLNEALLTQNFEAQVEKARRSRCKRNAET